MKLYIDTANLEEIELALKWGCIRGITTNPSLLAKEPKDDYLKHMRKIVTMAREHGNLSVSIEVFSDTPEEMVSQAKRFRDELDYEALAIKVHVSHGDENKLSVVRAITEAGIRVNCTACMTSLQAAMAAAAGAHYVSLFYNRLRDGGSESEYVVARNTATDEKALETSDFNPVQVIRDTNTLLKAHPNAQIIAGSIRTPLDIKHAGLAGAHVVTTSYKTLCRSLLHYKTDEAVDRFFNDFRAWLA